MNLKLFLPLIWIIASGTCALAQSADSFPAIAPTLELGYHQMYDLQFQDAHKTFRDFQAQNPGDPMGPTSDAAAYLFSELDRLGVLQSELFVSNEKFISAGKLEPDPASKQGFEKVLAKSELMADRALMTSPQNKNALFAKLSNAGLRGDYLALIEKRRIASLSFMKNSGVLAEKLLAIDPTWYDAYLAIGLENYILSLKAAPMRWMLRLYGAQTDKEEGISRLKLTAEKGHFLAPFARLLLAVAALRDKDLGRAKELLGGLALEFPNNKLYASELARLR